MLINPYAYATGGSTPWLPTNDSASIWIDASDTGTITEGGGAGTGVTQIDDKSGNSINFTASGGAVPATNTRTINSLNVLDFDGSTDYLARTSYTWPSSSKQLVYMVLPDDAVTGSNNCIARMGDGGVYYLLRAGHASQFLSSVDMVGGSNVDLFDGSANREGSATIWRVVFDISTNRNALYINGALVDEEAAGYQTALGNNQLHLMGNAGAGGFFLNGAFGEFHHFASADNNIGERSEGYLAHKWNITLPGGHTYFSGPPMV